MKKCANTTKMAIFFANMKKIMYLCTDFDTIMKTDIRTLRPQMLEPLAHHNRDLFVSESVVMLNRVRRDLAQQMSMIARVPQYVEVGRLIRVTQGSATFKINLIPFYVEQGCILIIPEHNYIEVSELADDFDVQIISFKHLPVSFDRCTLLQLNDTDFERSGEYTHLIWQVVHKPSFSTQTVDYLLAALMNDLQHIHKEVLSSQHVLTHSEQMMQQFMELVAEHGAQERNVPFYARQMHLTPNHLSALVRQHTGKSVMDWLNERTLLQARVMLRHTDQPISDIAFQLGFKETTLFSRFFLRETGMTPTEYRQQKPR